MDKASNLTQASREFNDAEIEEKAQNWAQAKSMITLLLIVLFGLLIAHALFLFVAWRVAQYTGRNLVPTMLVFPVPELMAGGLVALPLMLAATSLLVPPDVEPAYRAAGGWAILMLVGYQAMLYLVLLAVARRRDALGLAYKPPEEMQGSKPRG